MHLGRLVGQQAAQEARDGGRVGSLGILPFAEHVEEAQPDHLQPEQVAVHAGVGLVHGLGDGVGRERPSLLPHVLR